MIKLVCNGTKKLLASNPRETVPQPVYMGVAVNFTNGTISVEDNVARISKVNDATVMFGGVVGQTIFSGQIDRVTGSTGMAFNDQRTHEFHMYDLMCETAGYAVAQ